MSVHTQELPTPAPEQTNADDKRKHTRFEVATQARVNVLGGKNHLSGQIADLSQAGFKLFLPVAFPVGEIIRAEVADEVFVAIVCYSKKSQDGYVIGTELVHSIKRTHLNELVGEWGDAS